MKKTSPPPGKCRKEGLSIRQKAGTGNPSGTDEITGIRFDLRTNLFLALLVLYVLFCTLFNINGSSVGIWEGIFPSNEKSQILLGSPKVIRGDEWTIYTPAILSQCNSIPSFPLHNESLGGYRAPLVMNVPVKHFSMILRPSFWLFFVAGPERGFAFFWSMKFLILVAGVFLLLMLILENDFLLAVFGALWVYFSGLIQWFYSNPTLTPELVGYFCLAVAGFIQGFVSRKKMEILMSFLVFGVASFNFIILFYPPHQVTLTYLGLAVLAGFFLARPGSDISALFVDRLRMSCFVITFLLTAGVLFLYYIDAGETLKVLSNTVYPGQRRSAGGEDSLARIFNGFIGIFMSEDRVPGIWGNVCEASNFFLFFPVAAVLMIRQWYHDRKLSSVDAAFAIFIAIILTWELLGFPQWLARLTLFDRVYTVRALLPLGLASVFWTCFSLHRIMKESDELTWKVRLLLTCFMIALVLIHSIYVNHLTGGFASAFEIAAACLIAGVSVFLWINRQPLLFSAVILIVNLIAFGLVNPVNVGLKPVLQNPFYGNIRKAVLREPEAKWVFYGDRRANLSGFTANFAYATGAKVFNGLKFIPDIDQMIKISPAEDSRNIYNRYGFFLVLPSGGSEIRFKLGGEDSYTMYADPNNEIWRRLRITYAVFPSGDKFNIYRLSP